LTITVKIFFSNNFYYSVLFSNNYFLFPIETMEIAAYVVRVSQEIMAIKTDEIIK
jgi:hypothetical protein